MNVLAVIAAVASVACPAYSQDDHYTVPTYGFGQAPSDNSQSYDNPPQPPTSPSYPHESHSSFESGPPAYMQSLMEEFDRALAAERSQKTSSASPNPTHSSSTSIPKSTYDEPSRPSTQSSLPTSHSYNPPPVHRSTTNGPSWNSYDGPSTAASDGSNNVPNYGPSSGSPNYDRPTPSYNGRTPQPSSYGERISHDDRSRPTPNYSEANFNSNSIPRPQGSRNHYNHHEPSMPSPASGPSRFINHGPNQGNSHQRHNDQGNSHQDQGPSYNGQGSSHPDQGPSYNTQGNNHQDQGPSYNDHNHGHGPPSWPTNLPGLIKDKRAEMKEERVGGENREGKPWGHKKKYVYRDPKNGNNYMEISEVHMSMNKEYKPDEAASDIQRMFERNHRFSGQTPRSDSPFPFDSSEQNPFAPPF